MNEIYARVADLQSRNQPHALCIVVDSKGSTPRKAGSKMIVFPDGKIIGTIGGGALEMKVIKEALEAMQLGLIKMAHYSLDKDLAMQCGGDISVYIEAFGKSPELFVFGAGHIGRELGAMAVKLGFRLTFVDERPGIFEAFALHNAKFINNDCKKTAREIEVDNNTFIVICTHEHALDQAILGELAQRNPYYIGLMASKRKAITIRKNLEESGQLTAQQLENVDMPIGIPIKAETPFEIALSIAARLTDAKNNKSQN